MVLKTGTVKEPENGLNTSFLIGLGFDHHVINNLINNYKNKRNNMCFHKFFTTNSKL